MKKTIIASVLATTLLITSSVVNAAPITAKAPAPGFPLADGIDLDATSIESQVSDTEITAIAPAPGFPYADGIDLCADEPPITITSGDALYSRQHYSSSGFYTGVYVGGSSNPSTFELDNNGYAQFSSVSQESVNPGETVSITYQTIDAGTVMSSAVRVYQVLKVVQLLHLLLQFKKIRQLMPIYATIQDTKQKQAVILTIKIFAF